MIECPRCPDQFRTEAALDLHLRIHDLRDKFAPVTWVRPVSSEERKEAEEDDA